jgi:hypothetical protein
MTSNFFDTFESMVRLRGKGKKKGEWIRKIKVGFEVSHV